MNIPTVTVARLSGLETGKVHRIELDRVVERRLAHKHLSPDTFGYSMFFSSYLCRFINWQVDAIRRIDPSALVTAGSSGQTTQSDKWNDRNYYSDNCLITAGGKSGVTSLFLTSVSCICLLYYNNNNNNHHHHHHHHCHHYHYYHHYYHLDHTSRKDNREPCGTE